HGAVFIHDFADDSGGAEPGDAREVHGRFRLAGADEDATIARAQRENVAGRARSCGFVFGSMAARIVIARSEALMPVVTPRRASMASQNAVPCTEVLMGDMSGRWSSSQRSSVSGMQIRPRPYLAMKLMASGVIFSAA